MPVIPSEVGGVEPGALAPDGGSGKRLRELCEVLLTARAKMLGFSRQMSHELSQLSPMMKNSIVSGLMEIVDHLNQFEIQPGDTRLTGKVKLGEDAGMASHFQRPGGVVPVQDRPTPGRFGERAHRPLGHVPLGPPMRLATRCEPPTPTATAVAMTMPWAAEDDSRGLPERSAPPAEPRRRRRTRPRSDEETERSASVKDGLDDGPYAELWRIARFRHRKGITRHEMDRLEHSMLCWVCLALLQETPPQRPEASYELREQALHQLALMGYARRAGKGWRPTPAGFEASGLVGRDGQLEVDP